MLEKVYAAGQSLVSGLRSEKGTKHRLTKRKNKQRRYAACESLEARQMLTTTLFIDFGEGFIDGRMRMTAAELVNTATGPDLMEASAGQIAGSDIIEFQSLRSVVQKLKFDYTKSGGRGDSEDYLALKHTILDVVRRVYAPFDIDVREARASNAFDIRSAYFLNSFDPTGEHDAYTLVTGIVDITLGVTIGDFLGLYGLASGIDLTAAPGGLPGFNITDEASFVTADTMLLGSQLTGFDAGVGLGNVTAHEAGHTLALRHTKGDPLFFPDQTLQNESDIMIGGAGNDLFTIGMLPRFDIMVDYLSTEPYVDNANPANTTNHYEKLANDPDIGIRNDFAYVTGTGAYDDIIITRVDDTMALVSVQSFRNATFSFQSSIDVGPYTYLIDYTNGIVVDAGRSDDRIQIDSTLGVEVTVYGGHGRNDLVVFSAGSTTADFTPDSEPIVVPGLPGATSGTINTSGGGFGETVILFSEFTGESSVLFDGFENVNYRGPRTGAIDVTINGSAIRGVVNGPNGLVPSPVLRYTNTLNLSIDTTLVDPLDNINVDDRIEIGPLGFAATGLRDVTIRTGRGDDRLIFGTSNLTLTVPGGALIYDAGSGVDTIGTAANGDFTLTDGELFSGSGGSVVLQNLLGEVAEIAGGGGANTFTIESWSGTGTVDGRGGNDTFIFGTSGNLNTFTGHMTVMGGGGADTIILDDSSQVGAANYSVGKTRVASDSSMPAPFGRVYFDKRVEDIVMIGTQGRNVFNVWPGQFTTIKIDGLNPIGGAPPQGDKLSINFGSASNRTHIPQGAGAGIWTFTSGEQPIYYQGIEDMGSLFATAASAGASNPLVKVYNSLTNQLVFKFHAYEDNYTGGVNLTMADVTGDGVLDVITAPGRGRVGEVKVFDGALMMALADVRGHVAVPDFAQFGSSIFPEGTSYRYGYHVAAGDITGDGNVEIVTSRLTGRGKIRIFEVTAGPDFRRIRSLTPYSVNEETTRGATVAVGDLNGNGRADIVTTPYLAPARIKVWRWNGTTAVRTNKFFGFESRLRAGASLAVGDVTGDGRAEIFAAAGNGGGSRIRVFNEHGTRLTEYVPFTGGNRNAPLQIAARESAPGDVAGLYIAQSTPTASTRVRMIEPLTGRQIDTLLEADPEFLNGISIG